MDERIKSKLYFKPIFSLVIFCFINVSFYGNSIRELKSKDSTLNKKTLIHGSLIGGAAASLIGINHVWYKNYPKTSFHLFDDFKEWNGMDKVGHVCTSYHLNHNSYLLLKKNGINKPLLKSSLYTFSYMMGVEFIDGFQLNGDFQFMI